MIQMELMEKNRVYSLHLKNNNTHFNGFLRDIGDKWILMEDISLECMLDGVLLVNKEYINRIMRTEHDLFVENLIKSQRRQNKNLSNAYPLDDLDSLLHFIWKKGGLIMITKKEGGAGYVGEIARLLSSSIYLIEMDTDGNWINPPLLYRKKTIRTILIGNNYLNSLANYNRSKYTNESEIMIFTYHIKGWKETIKGILVQEEKEWLLIKLLTDDFILDGYSIIQKRYLSKKTEDQMNNS